MGMKNRARKGDDVRCDCLRRREEGTEAVVSRRMTGERRKLAVLLESVRRDLGRDLELAKREIIESTRAVETSVDLIAQEIARRGKATK
jgi:hypothetical protein